jgi:hypothetical protein
MDERTGELKVTRGDRSINNFWVTTFWKARRNWEFPDRCFACATQIEALQPGVVAPLDHLRQRSAPRLAALVGLPVFSRTDVEAREPAIVVDPGIDAHCMADAAGDGTKDEG